MYSQKILQRKNMDCFICGTMLKSWASLSGKAVLHLLTTPANYTTGISQLVHCAFTWIILSCLSFELPWYNPDSQVSSHLLPSLKIISSSSSKINSQTDIKNQVRSPSPLTMRALYMWPTRTVTWGKLTYAIQRDMNLTSAGESQLISSGLLTASFA